MKSIVSGTCKWTLWKPATKIYLTETKKDAHFAAQEINKQDGLHFLEFKTITCLVIHPGVCGWGFLLILMLSNVWHQQGWEVLVNSKVMTEMKGNLCLCQIHQYQMYNTIHIRHLIHIKEGRHKYESTRISLWDFINEGNI